MGFYTNTISSDTADDLFPVILDPGIDLIFFTGRRSKTYATHTTQPERRETYRLVAGTYGTAYSVATHEEHANMSLACGSE